MVIFTWLNLTQLNDQSSSPPIARRPRRPALPLPAIATEAAATGRVGPMLPSSATTDDDDDDDDDNKFESKRDDSMGTIESSCAPAR